MHEAERALFELERGRSLYVTAPDNPASGSASLLAAVEGLQHRTLDQLREVAGGSLRLAVTHHRARSMGLTSASPSGTNGQPHDLSLGLNGESEPEQILRLSAATDKYDADALDLRDASAAEVGGLALARLGRLLPAVVGVPVDDARASVLRPALASGAILAVTTGQIAAMTQNVSVELTHVSGGSVPLDGAEDARFMLFREANGVLEHLAILIGARERWSDPVPVRIHSACLTGDLFGSLRCDCGEQLRGSLRVFSAGGGGVLIYLSQEGRGIGLGNKFRAYALQHEGLDTVEADGALGFGADDRRYGAAVEMLQHLEVDRIQLLTNNPEKVRAVQDGGIQVVDRQPIYGTLNRHNVQYVRTKVDRAGHWLAEMLSGAAPGK